MELAEGTEVVVGLTPNVNSVIGAVADKILSGRHWADLTKTAAEPLPKRRKRR